MRRFIVPAIFVVDLYDNEGEEMALEVATRMQEAANRAVLARTIQPPHCMLDEELPVKEVQVHPDETEIPGTYLIDGATNAGCDCCGTNDREKDSMLCKECNDELTRRDEKNGLYGDK